MALASPIVKSAMSLVFTQKVDRHDVRRNGGTHSPNATSVFLRNSLNQCAGLTFRLGLISVDIGYPTRSRFLAVCEAVIRDHHAELKAGGTIRVGLPEGGYDAKIIVTISPANRQDFGTDWEGLDSTRFPARIRAAAAALRNCHFEGRFEVAHSGGSLTIRAV